MFDRLTVFAALVALTISGPALAQGSQIAFGNMQQDGSLPVEVTADNLDVDQTDGTAVFTGNVRIGQGEMRLSAPRVVVVYKDDKSGIARLRASGGVTLVSGPDAAEAARADYNIDTGMIEMQGDVLLLQGANALSAERMTVDTRAGTARMSGRVKTVIQQGEEQ
ncbi:LptA/OstA family protein [Roseovarius amoyensis]|uniref:LptA/OstA family protein n=1 Tax=Roseovarius amoyensis TaxID=2211448 RepID=UPI001EF79808|nr:LptA/OstA family protein [Roseovarius amoyensis]